MDGFAVDPGELRHAAGDFAQLRESLDSHRSLKYAMTPSEAGDAALAEAIEAFQDALTAVVRATSIDLGEIASRLDASAELYERSDDEVARPMAEAPAPAI
jgi:hypothetical protein